MIEAPYQSEDLADWLFWLERLDPSRIEFGLERIQQVYQDLDPLSDHTSVVTVAGTNGKGSSVAALQAASLALGKRVVAYTSPHILRYNERIQIDGKSVADRQLVEAFKSIAKAQKDTFLSYFEYSTLAALLIAAQEQPDLLILEVGLGGRLDAVNMVDANIVILTAIGLDHMNWLGEDLQSIAKEKCGVIRRSIPLVLAAPDMPPVVYQMAEQASANIYQWGEDFFLSEDQQGSYRLRVGKRHCDLTQTNLHWQSLAAAAMVVDLLWSPPLDLVCRALQSAELSGRFQSIWIDDQQIVFDVAHNPMSMDSLCQRLRRENMGKLNIVFAMMEDKDWQSCIEYLQPLVNEWHLLRLDNSRAESPENIADFLAKLGIRKVSFVEPLQDTAWLKNILAQQEKIPLLVTGSFYTVSTALARYNDAD